MSSQFDRYVYLCEEKRKGIVFDFETKVEFDALRDLFRNREPRQDPLVVPSTGPVAPAGNPTIRAAPAAFKKSWTGIYDLVKVVEWLQLQGWVFDPEKMPNLYSLHEYAKVDLNT